MKHTEESLRLNSEDGVDDAGQEYMQTVFLEILDDKEVDCMVKPGQRRAKIIHHQTSSE